MADSMKDKIDQAGHKIAETASKVGHKVSEKVEEIGDWAKEKTHQAGHRLDELGQKMDHKAKDLTGGACATGTSRSTSEIAEHMDVITSCGCKVGRVDHVEGDAIKLTKSDSPDGFHHLIPTSWVDHVDSHVHLNKNSAETRQQWQTV